ncbi:hypothetical protein Q5752_002073 [Cryptotrichosporon argae]
MSTALPNATAGPSTFIPASTSAGPLTAPAAAASSLAERKSTAQMQRGQPSVVPASKLAKNKRLPATMITPGGAVGVSRKKGAAAGARGAKKGGKRGEREREKAVERAEKLEVKARAGEERKAKRARAKKAWE